MIRLISAACLLVLLFISSQTVAQNQPAKKKDNPKKEEAPRLVKDEDAEDAMPQIDFDTTLVPQDELTAAIIELLKLTGAMELGKQMGRNIAEMAKSGAANQLPQEFYDRLLKECESEQTNKWMVNSLVRIYRQNFTTEEVKTITAFYLTPIGKKAISLLPVIMQQSMKEGEQIGRYLGMKVYYDLVREGKMK